MNTRRVAEALSHKARPVCIWALVVCSLWQLSGAGGALSSSHKERRPPSLSRCGYRSFNGSTLSQNVLWQLGHSLSAGNEGNSLAGLLAGSTYGHGMFRISNQEVLSFVGLTMMAFVIGVVLDTGRWSRFKETRTLLPTVQTWETPLSLDDWEKWDTYGEERYSLKYDVPILTSELVDGGMVTVYFCNSFGNPSVMCKEAENYTWVAGNVAYILMHGDEFEVERLDIMYSHVRVVAVFP